MLGGVTAQDCISQRLQLSGQCSLKLHFSAATGTTSISASSPVHCGR
uniref:Alternative protein ZNF30 n=1 Tax=Homo sapiens TaxID=9606 RepID=L8E9Q4_HUMAN|nr:alternative protein ZNF30 [Homo sapiens]